MHMIYVTADIHGNAARFESVLRQTGLRDEDTLYILGDVVDRYPDGIRILRRIMKMKNARMLLGNHELMMLKAADTEKIEKDGRFMRHWYRNGGEVTYNYLKYLRCEQKREIFDFVRSLPLNFDVEVNGRRFKLVHGSPVENYPFGHREYSSLTEYAVWERWKPDYPIPDGYTLIFGHTPTPNLQEGEPWRMWTGERAYGIDCGCGYSEGRLLCLRLDDMKEFYSEETFSDAESE